MEGIIIGISTFLIIGLFHPVVIKAEYYWGTRCWWIFLVMGILGIIGSLLIADILLSSLLGVFSFSSFWTIKELFEQRKEKQPLEYPSAGSTFKRKGEIITAKLIDECGLKGTSVGDASVSEKHAGFIINKGKATAKDVLELVEHIKKTIKEKNNLDIELEIIVLGDEK